MSQLYQNLKILKIYISKKYRFATKYSETRKFIKKDGYKLDQAEDLIKHANKLGMWTISTNIVGFPYETSEQIRDTIEFSKKSQTFRRMAIFGYYPP